MTNPAAPDLAALIASRICHDLISPIGAISNGVELLGMERPGPELDLLAESAAHANARIRLFRIAFGAASPGQRVGRAEIAGLLSDLSRTGRVTFAWSSAPDLPRAEVRLAFLLLQCLESALAYGGKVTVFEDAGTWVIGAEAQRLRVEPALWAILEGATPPADLPAGQVHFALAAQDIATLGKTLSVGIDQTTIRLTV